MATPISSPPQISYIAELPLELLEQIISAIEKPNDLLSCGLTSKHLHDIIIPFHIQFRIIRTPLSQIGLWKLLSSQPRLAANVRYLTVVGETEEPRVDPSLQIPAFVRDQTQSTSVVKLPSSKQVDSYLEEFLTSLNLMRNLAWLYWTPVHISPHASVALPSIISTIGCNKLAKELWLVHFTDRMHETTGWNLALQVHFLRLFIIKISDSSLDSFHNNSIDA